MTYTICLTCPRREDGPLTEKSSFKLTDEFRKDHKWMLPGFVLRCLKCNSGECLRVFLD